jgi:methylation protein EvaC
MVNINEFTVCLHCGFSKDIVRNQMSAINTLQDKYNIHWNNRIDRHPYTYPSFSEMMNENIITSKTEWIITINDRVRLVPEEITRLINLLEEGYSCVFMWNAGFMGFSKELIRKIGWWDERFLEGGYEDRDWVIRLKENNVSLYESIESNYDLSFRSPLNGPPGVDKSFPHWMKKYELRHSDKIIKTLGEEDYPEYIRMLGKSRPDIRKNWKSWNQSMLHVNYGNRESGSSIINKRTIVAFKSVDRCPITGTEGNAFLKFDSPLAGGFIKENEIRNERIYPLTLTFYPESSLVMVNERIPPSTLFSKYFYRSGSIPALVNHFKLLSEHLITVLKFKSVLEIGCNDFTLLKCFHDKGYSVLGIDPSDVSYENKISERSLINDFFSHKLSEKIKDDIGKFDLILSTNSFAHIDDILDTSKGINNILSDEGSFIFEVHWIGTVLKKFQFPFIYHEHIYYYTAKALIALLSQVGMDVYHIDSIDMHGGSIRVYSCKKGFKPINNSVKEFLIEEKNLGLYSFTVFKDFSSKVKLYAKSLKRCLENVKKSNKRIVGYGASGQSTTFLNLLGIGKDLIDFLVDDSPLKMGMFSPGTHLPIKSCKEINPETDVVLILAYTFASDIIKNIGNCEYIIPLPRIEHVKNDRK